MSTLLILDLAPSYAVFTRNGKFELFLLALIAVAAAVFIIRRVTRR